MIIARESVHEAEDLMDSRGVHYEVDSGQGKAVFRISPINIDKINAGSPFSICLLDKNHISQPVGVIYFSDNSGLEEFANLFVDRLLPFWGEASSLMFDEFEGGGDIQFVGDNCWVDSPMSSCFQAKTSTFCFKKRMRRSLTSSASLDPM